jgi:hypothetical protein
MAPNKIIFQIGILAFCVTAVILGLQNVSLMETISRSFVVFVGVVLTVALALTASSLFVNKRVASPEPHVEKQPIKQSNETGGNAKQQ